MEEGEQAKRGSERVGSDSLLGIHPDRARGGHEVLSDALQAHKG